jgi:hypothetical protein
MVQVLAPGVPHGEAPNLRAQMRGVQGDVLERLGDRAQEQAIEWAWVLKHQGTQVVRQSKDDRRVGRLAHLAFPGGEPRGLGRTMAFGTAAVAARVLRLGFVPTVVALGDMSAQGGRTTQRDGA